MGAESGDLLIAGGDVGGKLEGVIELATSTVSSNTAQIFDTSTDTFVKVGNLNTARESAAAVALPNGKTLIVGGEDCGPSLYGGAIGSFLCTTLNTAELYDETSQTFTFTAGNMTTSRSGPTATLIPVGSGTSIDGQVLIVGGSTGISFLGATTPPGAPSATALNSAEVYNPSTNTFSAISGIPGCPAGESSVSTPACSTALPSVCALPTVETPISTITESGTTATVTTPSGLPPGLTMGSNVIVAGNSVNSTGASGNPGYNNSWIVTGISGNTFTFTDPTTGLATGTGGFATAGNIASTSVSGTSVTVTMNTAVPSGLIVGDNVTVSAVQIGSSITANTYDGEYVVTGPGATGSTVTGNTFTYTTTAAPSGSGAGGVAVADTFECGIVDQGAAVIPSDGGNVLLAGGDFITFLGESSNFSFIFDATSKTFSKTTGNLTTPRELSDLIAFPSAGNLVAFGGIEANSAVCPVNSGEIVATTVSTAEVYNPGSQTWSAASNTMGAKKAVSVTPITTGMDAGLAILPGGVDVEIGTLPSTCQAVTSLSQAATNKVDLYNPSTTTFTATGVLTQGREGATQEVLVAGGDEADVLVAGGACTQASPTLESAPIGTSTAATVCGSANAGATGFYSELFTQSAGTWAKGPLFATGFNPANAAAFVTLP